MSIAASALSRAGVEQFAVLTDAQKARLKEILASKADPTKKDDKK
jgi:hypothetical protein